jgi:hypothetical protein
MRTLIDWVTPHLPADVQAVRVRLGVLDALLVWAVPSDVPHVADYEFVTIHTSAREGSITFRGPIAPFGVGTWLPFVPELLRRRIAVADGLSLVQDAVQEVVTPWPGPNVEAKAKVDGDAVVVWFQDPAGQRPFPELRIPVRNPQD